VTDSESATLRDYESIYMHSNRARETRENNRERDEDEN
jgi:hypothetical protein